MTLFLFFNVLVYIVLILFIVFYFSLQRVQCGDHFTVACTTDNHLYYWGLRFKPPAHQRFASGASDHSKDMTLAISSRSSLSKERCSSDSCLASSSPKEFTFDAYDCMYPTRFNSQSIVLIKIHSLLSSFTDIEREVEICEWAGVFGYFVLNV